MINSVKAGKMLWDRGNGELLLNGHRVAVWNDEKALKMNRW